MFKNHLKSFLILLFNMKMILCAEQHSLSTKLENVRGSYAAGVYEHQINGKHYIEKTFKEEAEFKGELSKVLLLQEPLKKYRVEKTPDMPNFAQYHAHQGHSITYEKAEGETVWDFLIRLSLIDIDFCNPNTISVLKNLTA